MRTLRKPQTWQVPAVQYVTDTEHDRDCVGLYMEKRLGKCFVITRWVFSLGVKRILIVAPLSAIPDWINELEADGQRVTDCTHPGDCASFVNLFPPIKRHFAIVNSQGLFSPKGAKVECKECGGKGWEQAGGPEFANLYQEKCLHCDGKGKVQRGESEAYPIAMLDYDCVIWDESVTLKNPQSQVTKIAHACFGDVKHKAVLSGEYAPEGPEDIFEPMVWCFGEFMGFTKFWPWRDEFFIQHGYSWYPKVGSMKRIKAAVMERCYVLSRKDAGIGEIKTFDRRYCELDRKFREIYDDCEKHYQLPVDAVPEPKRSLGDHTVATLGTGVAAMVRFTKYAPVLHGWLTQLSGGYPKGFPKIQGSHKMDLLLDLITGEYKKEPLVVSFAFNAELHAAAERLAKTKTSLVAVWGSMPGGRKARRAAVKAFQDGDVRVILKQAKIHYGMNLSRASTMIRYSLPFAYNDISQDMDRIVNPSTKHGVPLAYVDLIAKDTIDEDNRIDASDKRITARMYQSNREARFLTRTEKQHGGIPGTGQISY